MNALLALDVLSDVSYALVEPVVNTSADLIVPGLNTIQIANAAGVYQGAQLVILKTPVDTPTSQTEEFTILAMTGNTITANFAFIHAAGSPVIGPTFPSGLPDHRLFTLEEMLGYLADVQNDFLLRVRPIYKMATQAIQPNIAVYSNPSDAIRIERIAMAGRELSNVEQRDIDWVDPGWQQSGVPPTPDYWYQDGLTFQKFGIAPPAQRNDTVELLYSGRGATTLGLADALLVPDVMAFILKFGVLARAWSKDGEQRDNSRASFCQQMYDLWCMVAAKFMDGTISRMARPEETVEPLIGSMK